MHYAELPLRAELRSWVRKIWVLRGPAERSVGAPEVVAPDGCVELVLNFADPFEQVCQSGGRVEVRRQPRTILVGEVGRPVAIRPSGVVDLLGVRFEPGGAYAALGDAFAELAGEVWDGEAVLPRPLREAVRRVAGEGTDERRSALLESALIACVAARPPGDGVVEAAVRLVVQSGGAISVAGLERRVGLSERQIERRFARQVGLSPKTLGVIVRFQRVLTEIQRGSPSWADVAVGAGYADQAHLIRHFRRFTGTTPTGYVSNGHPLASAFTEAPFERAERRARAGARGVGFVQERVAANP
jgi:AraC-like DNA-binding protein